MFTTGETVGLAEWIIDDTFTFSRIENQHVQFQVVPNPQNIDANLMAKRIGKKLQKTHKYTAI